MTANGSATLSQRAHCHSCVTPAADEELLQEEAGNLADEVARMRAARAAVAAATSEAGAALAAAHADGGHPLVGPFAAPQACRHASD